MKFSDFDPYLKAEHLAHSVTVTVERFERINTHPRPGRSEPALVAHFRGKAKGLILSTVNRRTLASMFGDDTDAAVGKKVQLRVQEGRIRVHPAPGEGSVQEPKGESVHADLPTTTAIN